MDMNGIPRLIKNKDCVQKLKYCMESGISCKLKAAAIQKIQEFG